MGSIAAWEGEGGVWLLPCGPTLAATFLATAFLLAFCSRYHPVERFRPWEWPLALLPWGFLTGVKVLRLLLAPPAPGPVPPSIALEVVGIVPYVEELLYRGLFCRVASRRHGPVLGILGSAAAFALDHRQPGFMPHAFSAGIALGILGVRTRSLLLCVACHSGYNAMLAFW
ncbi:CPBP family intramembrane glutamic endopeptidase [Mesoterricola silvestris]|uniref:CPBP family intramembrane glutamic endopeptidase n=1 Tax=Mesoterricola silvestris TaxID=2927979 RepID=UPI002931663C|nr:CPBP family intramembrane glutamic endopeptidase [Mesoterricola silvestris]